VPYYYNTETKASVWVMPPELAAALAEVDAEEEAALRGGQGSLVRCVNLENYLALLANVEYTTWIFM